MEYNTSVWVLLIKYVNLNVIHQWFFKFGAESIHLVCHVLLKDFSSKWLIALNCDAQNTFISV